MPDSRDTLGGWYSGARPITIPITNFAHGHSSRDAVVLHIITGSQASARQKFQTPTSETSVHFSIGKNGQIEQYVSVLDTAYGNGLRWNGQHWVDPQGVVLGTGSKPAPSWRLLRPPTNPNWQTISIEHEGRPEDIPTGAMVEARTALLRWLSAEFPTLRMYVPHISLIGHFELSPASKPNCPGPHFDFAAIAAAVTAPRRYVYAPRLPIYQESDLNGPIAGYVLAGEQVEIDARAPLPGYAPNAGHLADGRGFVALDALERL